MKVVFLEDVSGVAQGGDVKEVKNGFARNYLIPKNLAVPVSHNALQGVAKLAREAGVVRIKTLADMKALGEELDGVQVNVEMRAGAGGRLYGSVTNAIVAEQLSEMTDREIDRRTVDIAEPMRELGMFDVTVRVHPEVEAQIKVLVYATGTDPADFEGTETEDGDEAEDGAETEVDAEVAVANVEGGEEEASPSETPAEEEDGESETSEGE
jgi:large subunit ribosomal protein L9